MPNFNSVKQLAGTKARARKLGAITDFDTVAITGQASADTMTCFLLPIGAILHSVDIASTAAIFATSCTIQVGNGTTAALFGTSSGITTGLNHTIICPSIVATTVETNLVLTISAASGAAGAQTLTLRVNYDLQGF